jgi:uncharacterized protein
LGRIIFLLIIAFLIYLVFRGFFKSATKPRDTPPATMSEGEDMVVCTRCGVNLPRSSATLEGDKLVCADNPKCLEARK